MTFIIIKASVNAFRTLETDLSLKISDITPHKERNNRQNETFNIDGKNTSATAIIPTMPTLLFIKDEYACMDNSPSLIAPPITGTTEFIANRTERRPIASALDATAVLIERTETNTVAHTEMPVIKYFFIFAMKERKFNSSLIPEQIPIARKQLERGKNTLLEIKLSACAKDKRSVLVENAATVLPDVATIMQNAGINANTKSEHTEIAVQAEEIVSFIFVIKIIATITALTVETAEVI